MGIQQFIVLVVVICIMMRLVFLWKREPVVSNEFGILLFLGMINVFELITRLMNLQNPKYKGMAAAACIIAYTFIIYFMKQKKKGND